MKLDVNLAQFVINFTEIRNPYKHQKNTNKLSYNPEVKKIFPTMTQNNKMFNKFDCI